MSKFNFDDLSLIQSTGEATTTYTLDIPKNLSVELTTIEVPNVRLKTTPSEILTDTKSPAVLYVEDSKGKVIAMSNRFYLTGAQETMEERAQILDTFGLPSYSFYGEKSKIYNFSGHVLDADSSNSTYRYKNQWSVALTAMYNDLLRGSKLAEFKREAVLIYRNIRLRGFILNLNIVRSASNPNSNAFSFSMLIVKQEYLGDVGSQVSELYKVENFLVGGPNLVKIKQYAKDIDSYDEAPANNQDEFISAVFDNITELDDVTDPTAETLKYILKSSTGAATYVNNMESYIKFTLGGESFSAQEIIDNGKIEDLDPAHIDIIKGAMAAAEDKTGYLENRYNYWNAVYNYNVLVRTATDDAQKNSELFK